jgi:hypothetical protein
MNRERSVALEPEVVKGVQSRSVDYCFAEEHARSH